MTIVSNGRATLHDLQMLRAVAAILVVIDHSAEQVVGWSGSPIWIKEFGWFLGEQGVALFFVISGFIMSYTSDEFGSVDAARRFLLRRIVRVVPLYWFFTLLVVALMVGAARFDGRSIDYENILYSLFFIPFGDAPMRPVLGPGWTLNFEMIFYAIFASAMILTRSKGHLFVAFSLTGAVLAGRILFGEMTGDAGATPLAFILSPYLLLFLAGMAAGYFRLQIRTGRPTLIVVMALSLQAALFVALMPDYTTPLWRAVFWTSDFFMVLICLSGLSEPAARKPLAIMEKLGKASYSLYLSHIFIVHLVAAVWRSSLGQEHPAAYIATTLLIACAVSLFVFRFVERPLHKLALFAIASRQGQLPRVAG